MSVPHILRLLLLFIWCHNLLILLADGEGDATWASSDSDNMDHDHDDKAGAVVVEMMHRHSPAMASHGDSLGPPKSRMDRTRQLLEGDHGRRQLLWSHVKRLNLSQETAWIPVHSGADFGQGQYFVSLRVGSPPQKIILVTDTGSDLTWMNCQYTCKDCPRSAPHAGRIFRASESSSFEPIPCFSDFCKIQLSDFFSLNKCPSAKTPCQFDYRYVSGQTAVGVFANETLTVGLHNRLKVRLPDVLMGCTKVYNETEGFPDGVMGLGFRKHSLAVKLAETFGSKFSYCLVDHLSSSNLKNYLSFGDIPLDEKPKLEYTRLLMGEIGSFYAVEVEGISMGSGNKLLNISSDAWNAKVGGGMIIDSGTSLTMLSPEAYDPVADAFRPAFSKFEKIGPDSLNLPEFEFCFGLKGYDKSLVPSLVIHFVDGAKFEPPISSYIIDVAENIKCLGITRLPDLSVSVLGNIMQQSHFWEFDIGTGKLGYGPSSCVLSSNSSKSSTH